MLRHLHQMVPAGGPIKRKRQAGHHGHSSSSTNLCKRPAPPRHELDLSFDRACSLHGQGLPSEVGTAAVDSSRPSCRQGDVNGSNCPGELLFVLEESTSTDDESEFSSSDGRSSPSSHTTVSWGPSSNQGSPGFVETSPECFQTTPLGVGFATPRANGVAKETPIAEAEAVSTRGRRVCSSSGGDSTEASCVYGGAPINHHHQQQQQIYESQEQQHYQDQGKRQVVRDGGRSDADVWGWFVDAGEDQQPSRASVGVQNY
ncbi:unnamed protein product [Laminaria digitata]